MDEAHAYHRFVHYVVGNLVDDMPEEPVQIRDDRDFRTWCRWKIGRSPRRREITLRALLYKEYRRR